MIVTGSTKLLGLSIWNKARPALKRPKPSLPPTSYCLDLTGGSAAPPLTTSRGGVAGRPSPSEVGGAIEPATNPYIRLQSSDRPGTGLRPRPRHGVAAEYLSQTTREPSHNDRKEAVSP